MRSFLAVFVSSLLLSVSVQSHAVSPTHSSSDKQVVRISVQADNVHWISENTAVCREEESPCPQKTTNRYGFRCKKKFFNQEKVMAAAEKGCVRISKNSQGSAFPKAHTATSYWKPGPYVEWPIKKNGKFLSWFGSKKYRLVMTMDCTVVGAVTRNRKGKSYTPCEVERH